MLLASAQRFATGVRREQLQGRGASITNMIPGQVVVSCMTRRSHLNLNAFSATCIAALLTLSTYVCIRMRTSCPHYVFPVPIANNHVKPAHPT